MTAWHGRSWLGVAGHSVAGRGTARQGKAIMTNTADQRPEMTMDEVTFAALNASIEAWELKLVTKDPRKIKMGRAWCPLCLLFNTRGMSDDDTCYGCPVSSARNAWRAAAQAEIDFLRSLLPKEDGQ